MPSIKPKQLEGWWRSRGHGWTLHVTPDTFELYDTIGLVSLLRESGSIEQLSECFDRFALASPDELSLFHRGDLTQYQFDRSDGPVTVFPSGQHKDPVANFDFLCQLFDEHHAFLGERGVDWKEANRIYRPRVTASASDEKLLDVFAEMLAPLHDNHVYVASPARVVTSDKLAPLRPGFQEAFGLPTGRVSSRSTVDGIAPQISSILLAEFPRAQSTFRSGCNDVLSWCELEPGIGYINVLRLFGFADTLAARTADDLPHARIDAARFLEDDMAALDREMDRVMIDLASMRAIVVDIRINGGGFDRAGLTIANRFAETERLAYTKQAKWGSTRTTPQEICVHPVQRPSYHRPVVLMTSPLTLSAGEVFALCMRALPNVTTIGETTLGILSDNLLKCLPNGWEASLSNEIYIAADGNVYEVVGVPPEVPAPVFGSGPILEPFRASLAAAVQLARSRL